MYCCTQYDTTPNTVEVMVVVIMTITMIILPGTDRCRYGHHGNGLCATCDTEGHSVKRMTTEKAKLIRINTVPITRTALRSRTARPCPLPCSSSFNPGCERGKDLRYCRCLCLCFLRSRLRKVQNFGPTK